MHCHMDCYVFGSNEDQILSQSKGTNEKCNGIQVTQVPRFRIILLVITGRIILNTAIEFQPKKKKSVGSH